MDWRVFEQEENLAGGHYLSFFGGQNDGAGFDSIRFDVAAEVAPNTGDVGCWRCVNAAGACTQMKYVCL